MIADYLARISYDGPTTPTLDALYALHVAHLAAVPYENLDIQLGVPGPLTASAVLGQIVRRRRGGYCFQLNGAFGQLLTALGFRVTYATGAVGPRDAEPSWGNHHVLLVDLATERWIADVGLGDGFLEPLPLRPGSYSQGPFRYTVEPGWYVGHDPVGACAGYHLRPQPRTLADFVPHHERLSTSPDSSFVKVLTVQQPRRDHTLALRGTTLTTGRAGERSHTVVDSYAEWVAVLADEFGLPVDGIDTAALYPVARRQTEAWLAAQG